MTPTELYDATSNKPKRCKFAVDGIPYRAGAEGEAGVLSRNPRRSIFREASRYAWGRVVI